MDSLTAIELKKRLEAQLGGKLPNTLPFNYPSVRALSGRLLEERFPDSAGEEAAADGEAEPTEDELLERLARKLDGEAENRG